MPPKDSDRSERTEGENTPEVSTQDEIVTPIEAEIQAKAKHEFETERKIPVSCKTAIVSVNGEDVAEVPLAIHERAA
jgi:hypothetical protein